MACEYSDPTWAIFEAQQAAAGREVEQARQAEDQAEERLWATGEADDVTPKIAAASQATDQVTLLGAYGPPIFLIVSFLGYSFYHDSTPLLLLTVCGLCLGVVFKITVFSFTAAIRDFVAFQDGNNLRAITLCLWLTSTFTAIIFSYAVDPNEPTKFARTAMTGGAIALYEAPISLASCVGAFLFGVGMQLGDGCSAGTCGNAAKGSPRSLIVIPFFIIGAFVSAATSGMGTFPTSACPETEGAGWIEWPGLKARSFMRGLGGYDPHSAPVAVATDTSAAAAACSRHRRLMGMGGNPAPSPSPPSDAGDVEDSDAGVAIEGTCGEWNVATPYWGAFVSDWSSAYQDAPQYTPLFGANNVIDGNSDSFTGTWSTNSDGLNTSIEITLGQAYAVGSVAALSRDMVDDPAMIDAGFISDESVIEKYKVYADGAFVTECFLSQWSVMETCHFPMVTAQVWKFQASQERIATNVSGVALIGPVHNLGFKEVAIYTTTPPKGDPESLYNVALLREGAVVDSYSSAYDNATLDDVFGANSAIDGNPSTAWATAGDGASASIAIKLQEPFLVGKVAAHSRDMVDDPAMVDAGFISDESVIEEYDLYADGLFVKTCVLTQWKALEDCDFTPITAQTWRFQVTKERAPTAVDPPLQPVHNTGMKELAIYTSKGDAKTLRDATTLAAGPEVLMNVALLSAGASVRSSSNWGDASLGAANVQLGYGKDSDVFGAYSAIDGNQFTAWAAYGEGVGAWIEVTLEMAFTVEKVSARSRDMVNDPDMVDAGFISDESVIEEYDLYADGTKVATCVLTQWNYMESCTFNPVLAKVWKFVVTKERSATDPGALLSAVHNVGFKELAIYSRMTTPSPTAYIENVARLSAGATASSSSNWGDDSLGTENVQAGYGLNTDPFGANMAIDDDQESAWACYSEGVGAYLEITLSRKYEVKEVAVRSRDMVSDPAMIAVGFISDESVVEEYDLYADGVKVATCTVSQWQELESCHFSPVAASVWKFVITKEREARNATGNALLPPVHNLGFKDLAIYSSKPIDDEVAQAGAEEESGAGYDSIGASVGIHTAICLAIFGLSVAAEYARHKSFAGFLDAPGRYYAAVVVAALEASIIMIGGSPWGVADVYGLVGTWLIGRVAGDANMGQGFCFWYGLDFEHLDFMLLPNFVLLGGFVLGVYLCCWPSGEFEKKLQDTYTEFGAKSGGEKVGFVAGAAVGGFLMGVGSLMAGGCNIGALLGGAASCSPHTWTWLIFACLGAAAACPLRRFIGYPLRRARPPARAGESEKTAAGGGPKMQKFVQLFAAVSIAFVHVWVWASALPVAG